MGTTMVVGLWLGEKLAVANVGDSRLYLVETTSLSFAPLTIVLFRNKLTRE